MLFIRTLFISDLDGTLLNSNAEISDFTADTVNRLIGEGMFFTFATARSVYSAKPIAQKLGLNVPCLFMNGVSVYDLSEDRYVKNEFIPDGAAGEIISAFEKNSLHCFMYRMIDGKLTSCYTEITTDVMRSFAEVRKKKYKKPFLKCSSFREVLCGDTVYFTTTGEYEELLPVREIAENIEGADFTFYEDTYTHKWYLEIFSAFASKGNGIDFLREKYRFDRVVSFGDNLNDMSMFRHSDIKVAVANAEKTLKESADFIALSNDDDGVAKMLSADFADLYRQ